jgi:hypothetical protein
VGDVTVTTGTGVSVEAYPTGVEAVGAVGAVTVTTREQPAELNTWALAFAFRRKMEIERSTATITSPPAAVCIVGAVSVEIGEVVDFEQEQIEELMLLTA